MKLLKYMLSYSKKNQIRYKPEPHIGKWVYTFGDSKAEGNTEMKDLLGGKGANLAEMCLIGIPVPPGFTVTTEVCTHYYNNEKTLNDNIKEQILSGLDYIEEKLGLKLGSMDFPLLISVRSGARASMPGMMDTILNLGLNDITVNGLAKRTGNERFAYDSYRRFIQMYASVVLDLEHDKFELLLEARKRIAGVTEDVQLPVQHLKELINDYKSFIKDSECEFPQDVTEQLWGAINAVFSSWMNDRAKKYRQIHSIPESWGTAVNIQAMVFGNLNENSATGVCFTRNPSTGEKELFGEYLLNAQGEDVVAGIRTPLPIATASDNFLYNKSLEQTMNSSYRKLLDLSEKLERHYKDMQDIEFTIENGKLWILQTRSGKRSAAASVKIAVDLANEKMITRQQAILQVKPESLDQLLHPTLDPNAKNERLTTGLPASPGAVSGVIVFCSKKAEKVALDKNVILVRNETSPEDIGGMNIAKGILTARGGMTSHAAVIARGMGKPCITGAAQLLIDFEKREMNINGKLLHEGDTITISGSTGEVFVGKVATIVPKLSQEFTELMNWVSKFKKIGVRANADTPQDAEVAKRFGAEGIGLCRTEHMFFKPERILAMRKMILSENQEEREAALAKLLPYQKQDFIDLFNIMAGLPITIRLLDPPLHEFLPHTEEEIEEVSKQNAVDINVLKSRVKSLEEINPMLGHRGCRLAITYPEIYEMQTRAIIEAALFIKSKVSLEIMVPLVMDAKEIAMIKKLIDNTASLVMQEHGKQIDYKIGTMIELPRAALCAEAIADHVQFFSFGTNDLTQTTLGISRDDAAKFIPSYVEADIFKKDIFASIDENGVGELIRIACEKGRSAFNGLKLGVCGEHGGDPRSIFFFEKVGIDYVSCSPYRVPIAQLACAQVALTNQLNVLNEKE